MGTRTKRKWKIERWTLEILPQFQSIEARTKLSLRDCVILVTSELDLALAELLSKRLSGPEHEIVEFLGADADGRAPCGSLGSRIQLARLIGLLTDEDAEVLRSLKNLRNLLAHRVKEDSPQVKAALRSVWDLSCGVLRDLFILIERLMRGDPKVEAFLATEDPTWEESKHQLEDLRRRWVEMTQNLRAVLQRMGLGSERTTLGAVLEVWTPKLMEHDIKRGAWMVPFVAACYQGYFRHILNDLTAIPEAGVSVRQRISQGWKDAAARIQPS